MERQQLMIEYSIRAVMLLAAAIGLFLYGWSRSTSADRRKIREINALGRFGGRITFSFFGYQLKAVAFKEDPNEGEALELAKLFWCVGNAVRWDVGDHAAIVFYNPKGNAVFSVGLRWLEAELEYKLNLIITRTPIGHTDEASLSGMNPSIEILRAVPIEEVQPSATR